MFNGDVTGHLGSDPEMRYMPSGEVVCNFSVAHNYKKGGRDYTEWVKVACWGEQLAEQANLLQKGDLVHVIGDVTFSEWTDATGKLRKSCEVRAQALGKVALPTDPEESAS